MCPPDLIRLSPIAQRVLRSRSLTYDASGGELVIAVKADLIVSVPARRDSRKLELALAEIATRVGTLGELQPAWLSGRRTTDADEQPVEQSTSEPGGPADDVELWRLRDDLDSIQESRRLRSLVRTMAVDAYTGLPNVPPVSPNHVAILAVKMGGCPASPPRPAGDPDQPGQAPFVRPRDGAPAVRIVELDSGYIRAAADDGSHEALDARVTLVDGATLTTVAGVTTSTPDEPDGLYLDGAGELDGITGHGTFIAGLLAHGCPQAAITVVGLRDQEVEITKLTEAEQAGLYATELDIAAAMLSYCRDADVIQCGFAFPSLADYASLPFAAVLAELRLPESRNQGKVAVVAPAGNESSTSPYWPAALPDVIGVAATDPSGQLRADFSNWGTWCDCATRGANVLSTFVTYEGPIEGEPATDIERFTGWARWDGTSFAAPKVSAAIASLVADHGLAPTDAWELIQARGTAAITDVTLGEHPPVTLTFLDLG
jgi:hypothetical protein